MLQVSTRSYLEYPIGKEATKDYPRLAILLTVKIWPVIIASNLPIVDLLSFFR